jgi:spermidine/putrescine transport system permease protein
MKSLSDISLAGFAVLALLFLYLPVAVLILFSFNDSKLMTLPLSGFTLDWYKAVFDNEAMMRALRNSLFVASISTGISVVVGTMAAFALDRIDFYGKTMFRRVILLPISLPGIIIGISILNMSSVVGLRLSLTTVILGHTAMLLAIVVTQVFARLQRLDRSIEEAAADLGASPWQTFTRVTLPNIRSALIGSSLLSFTVSFDDVPITFFLTGRENTLPMYIYSALRRGPSPEFNAVSTLILIGSLGLIIFSIILLSRDQEKSHD